MNLIRESSRLVDYLEHTEEVDYRHHTIQEKITELHGRSPDDIAYVKAAFEFVRDGISHSWDIRSSCITRTASEVLLHREGICYAKSNLLCALLRGRDIPAGFCYQRLTLGDTPDTGYAIHALNACYIRSVGKWIRLDARGNKDGVDAQFSLNEERLAFPIRDHYGEKDYPLLHKAPHPKTMDVLLHHTDCKQMYLHGLPTEL